MCMKQLFSAFFFDHRYVNRKNNNGFTYNIEISVIFIFIFVHEIIIFKVNTWNKRKIKKKIYGYFRWGIARFFTIYWSTARVVH